MPSYLDIFKRLRIEKNGAVSDMMQERGVNGLMNYGVSLPTIKSIAKEYAPDHKLASDLFRQEIREMRLAAIYIEDPQMVTLEQMELWGRGILSRELAQVASKELFCKVSGAQNIALKWWDSDNELLLDCARATIGRMASELQSDFLSNFISAKANAFMLREIFKYHENLREQILQISDSIFDLRWQLEEILQQQ